MVVTTSSGAKYDVSPSPKGLEYSIIHSDDADRIGQSGMCIAVFDDRIPFVEATAKVTTEGRFCVGYNANGVRTFRFNTSKVLKGMRLVNRKGLRSTTIVKVVA